MFPFKKKWTMHVCYKSGIVMKTVVTEWSVTHNTGATLEKFSYTPAKGQPIAKFMGIDNIESLWFTRRLF